ncbi:MAG: hypothetical protein MJ185_02955 [Treponema sp.]|nr:hypothetical protein [Treponema sp.]
MVSKEVLEAYVQENLPDWYKRRKNLVYYNPLSDDDLVVSGGVMSYGPPPASWDVRSSSGRGGGGASGSYVSKADIEDYIEKEKQQVETFQDYVRKIQLEKGLSDSDVYHKINMDQKYFNKIKNQKADKSISFDAAFMIGFALELDLEQIKQLINKAGRHFTKSTPRNLVMRYYVEHKNYDFEALNTSLYEMNLKPLSILKDDSLDLKNE